MAWTGINVTQAFLLEFISETALEGISGRLGIIVVWALGYIILEAALEFAFSCSELNVRSKISALFRNALMQRILECSIEEIPATAISCSDFFTRIQPRDQSALLLSVAWCQFDSPKNIPA